MSRRWSMQLMCGPVGARAHPVSQYEAIEQRLRHGAAQVLFDPVKQPGPREDPDWPTPQAPPARTPGFGLQGELRELFDRLSPPLVIRCALLAVQQVWPILRDAGVEALEADPPRPAAYRVEESLDRLNLVRYWLRMAPEERVGFTTEEVLGEPARLGVPPLMRGPMQAYNAVYFLWRAARAAQSLARYIATQHPVEPIDRHVVGSHAAHAVEEAARAYSLENYEYDEERMRVFLREWWSHCRRKLAVRDVESAEAAWTFWTVGRRLNVSGPSPETEVPPYTAYTELFERLDPGVPVSYALPDARRCDPPEDPEWPTPANRWAVQQLLERLPLTARLVCTLTALQMAQPIWERVGGRAPEQLERPFGAGAIELLRLWIEAADESDDLEEELGNIVEQARLLSDDLWGIYQNEGRWQSTGWRPRAAHALALALDSIPDLDADLNEPELAAEAVAEANRSAQAALQRGHEAPVWTEGFYRRWWQLCRCRLAVREIESTILEPFVEKPPIRLSRDEVFDAADGLYWYAAEHYNGMGDPLYQIVSTLGYTPGAAEGPPEFGEDSERNAAAEWYSRLESGDVDPHDLRRAIDVWYSERGERHSY